MSGGTVEERREDIGQRYPAGDYVYTHITGESSITIAQIHDLIKSLASRAQIPRLIWIEEAGLLTIPAQNALLKLLEEPPADTEIILSADNPQSLLATIRSRCRLHMLMTDSAEGDEKDLHILKEAMGMSDGERVTAADSLGRKREELVKWTGSCLLALNRMMKAEVGHRSASILTALGTRVHSAHTDLKANVNPSLVIQHLFLSLPRTKK